MDLLRNFTESIKNQYSGIDINSITTTNTDFNQFHPLYQKFAVSLEN